MRKRLDSAGIVDPREGGKLQDSISHPPLSVRSYGLTDPGRVRTANEDQFLIAVLRKTMQVEQSSLPQPKVQHSGDQAHLFIVADGMGGRAGGGEASTLAIDSVKNFVLESFKWFFQFKGKETQQVLAEFRAALSGANSRIQSEAARQPDLFGMGTTLTLAYALNDALFVAHVGDSRCYLCRRGVLSRLTFDHTLIEEMVRSGQLRREETAGHRWRHIITNVVGGDDPGVTIEVNKVHLKDGDRMLLCSDGLTEMIPDEEICQILRREVEPEQACRQLVARANDAGGRDNVTAVVAEFRAEH